MRSTEKIKESAFSSSRAGKEINSLVTLLDRWMEQDLKEEKKQLKKLEKKIDSHRSSSRKLFS